MAQSFPKKTKIAIVGAGPAGIYCAIHILKFLKENNVNNFQIDIFDKSQSLRTILKTGNGRCNITNNTQDFREFCSNYPRGEKFFYSLFNKHSNNDSVAFFNSIGIKTYTQDDSRVFPISNSAKDVKDKLLNYLKGFNNFKLYNKEITNYSQISNYDKIVIATGSRVSKEFIQSLKQPCVDFKKALCAYKIKDNIYPQGVSVKSKDGDFIFTKDGISGPMIFKLSSINAYKSFPFEISIKLFDYDSLEELIKLHPKKSITSVVSKLIPKSLAKTITKDNIKNACEIGKKDLEKLCYLNLTVIDYANIGEIVNAGGIDLDFLDKNCKSKLNDKLWFCGEIMNIDGFCGGFNLQNCWSSGYCCAKNIAEEIIKREVK